VTDSTKPADLIQTIADTIRREVRDDLKLREGNYLPVYWEGVAAAVIEVLQLEPEIHPNVPISVPEYNDDGSPVMDDRWVPPVHKRHFEWVTKRRWVTPYEEIGERETSAELSARLEANQ
jgi:hypothetical protein